MGSVNSEFGERVPKGLGKIIGSAVVGTAAALFAFGSFFTVDPNEVAVVTWFGQIERTEGPGFHGKWPIFESARSFRTDIADVGPKEAVNTYTVDNQEVDVLFNVFYRISADKATYIYQSVPDYRDRLFVMAIDRLKSELGKVNISTVAEKRGELRDAIKNVLTHDAASLGLEVTDFQLTNLEYDKRFRDAVANAAVMKAQIESVEYQKQGAQKQAEADKIIAVGKANAAREQARGEADGALLKAAANAKSTELRGQAEATAIKAQGDALKANPELVNLRKAERWDGKLPVNVYGSAPIPFLQLDGGK